MPGWWVPSDADLEPDRAPGHVVVRESQKWGRFPVEVVELRPMSYAAFRWASSFPGAELLPGHTTLVEFTVTPGSDGVTVAVREGGFTGLDATEELRAHGLEANSGGWDEEMASLRERAQASTNAG